MFYVTMTDKFMSGWGMAKCKTFKMVIACDSLEKAQIIEQNAKKRPEMKHVNICVRKPYYNKAAYITSYKKFDDLGEIWKEGYMPLFEVIEE